MTTIFDIKRIREIPLRCRENPVPIKPVLKTVFRSDINEDDIVNNIGLVQIIDLEPDVIGSQYPGIQIRMSEEVSTELHFLNLIK